MSTKSEKTGLMTKKKAELIDIILRKDDVERELRKELESAKLDFEKAKSMYQNSQKQLNAIKLDFEGTQKTISNYQSIIDDATLDNANNKHYISLYKSLTIILAVTTILATALIFIL